MKIAIIGTRGIPNHYGGFEQFAEYLSRGLVKKGHDVVVYNSHNHLFQESEWNGVKIRHIFDPEYLLGTAGQFIYDFLAILDSRSKDYDIIYQLGYTSSSIFFRFHPKNSLVVTNMDGLEWKRSKYSEKVKNFLRFAEFQAVKHSDFLIADSVGIQDYLLKTYSAESSFIPYGAHRIKDADQSHLGSFSLDKFNYNLIIARLEPENNIEQILAGYEKTAMEMPMVVIGNHETKYGFYLKDKFNSSSIRFLGGIYDLNVLDNLRYFSNIYFHGHSVGGTNPSLLEAMASGALICAHENPFNRSILGNDAYYFKSFDEVRTCLEHVDRAKSQSMIDNNLEKINVKYTWEQIISEYDQYFCSLKKVLK